MITIREYREADAESVGVLIADTFSKFNLSFAPSEDRPLFLGPFQHARSPLPEHQKSIARVLRAAMVFVADDDGQIAGILRGRRDGWSRGSNRNAVAKARTRSR
jgi:hypothetical protein